MYSQQRGLLLYYLVYVPYIPILHMIGRMMGNVLHGLEPIVGVSKLRKDQGIMGVSIKIGILKPMLVASEFNFDGKRMIKAFAQVTTSINVK